MYKTILVTILSITLCASFPQNSDASSNQTPVLPNLKPAEPPAPTVPTPITTVAPSKDNTGHTAVPEPQKTQTSEAAANTTVVGPTTNTSDVTTSKTEATTVPAAVTDAPKPTTQSPATNPTSTTAKVDPTVTSTTEAPTTAKPVSSTTQSTVIDKKTVEARGFDGPSFIGGIILTIGMLAVGFIGFKYYKNRIERNYHTL